MPIQPSGQYCLKLRAELINRTSRYERQVKGLYDNALNDISKLLSTVDYNPTTAFSFEDVGLMKRVDEIMSNLEKNIMATVAAGVQNEFGHSYANCMDMLKQVVSDSTYENVQKAFTPRLRSGEAAKQFLAKVPSASTRVWNGTTLAQMETAVQEGLMEGWGASRMATHLKQFLNEPDMYYRRFRIKTGETEEGAIYGRKWKKRILQPDGSSKWVDDDPKKYHPGTGVYRSSYQNALRYAGTTTNIAYRRADHQRYQEFPFVLGVEIRTSENNHLVPDICDELAGKYPGDFEWTGWHPKCRCYQVPILADESKISQMADAILNGDDPADVPVDGRIEEVPEKFTKWMDKNADRIKNATTLPYFLSDNGVRVDGVYTLKSFEKHTVKAPTPLEIAKKRHAERTTEQVDFIKAQAAERQQRFKDYATTKKRAANFLGMAGDWTEVDFSQLQDILKSVQSKSFFSTPEMESLKSAVLSIKEQIRGQQVAEAALADIIPEVHLWHHNFTIEELEKVRQSILDFKVAKAKKYYVTDFEDLSLAKQKSLFDEEAKYVSDATYLKPHTLHNTWEVAQATYLAQARIVEETIAWQDIEVHLASVKAYVSTHKGAKVIAKVVQEAETLKNNGASISEVEAKLADVDKRIAAAQKSMDTWLRNQAKAGYTGGDPFTPDAYTDARKNAAFYEKNGDKSRVDKRFRPETESVWAILTAGHKEALTAYTCGSGHMNRPLRGYDYTISGSGNRWDKRNFVGVGKVDWDIEGGKQHIIDATSAISMSRAKEDMWLVRGWETADGAEAFLGMPFSKILSMSQAELDKEFVGKIITDEAFSSCGTMKGTGFIGPLMGNIYCPRGTQLIYTEPFSVFNGDSLSTSNVWDGSSKYSLHRGFETIIQRGTKYRITKIYVEYGSIYADFDIVGQI